MLRPLPPPEGSLPPDDPAQSRLGLWLVVGVVLMVFGAMGALFFAARGNRHPDRLSSITKAELTRAEQHWKTNGPAAYTLELEFTGEGSGSLTLQVDGATVRGPQGTTAPFKSSPVRRVEDLFALMREDLAIVTDPKVPSPPGMAGLARDHMPLKVSFDSTTGLPRGYARPNLGDDRPALGWRVVRFESSEPSATAKLATPGPAE